MCASTGARRRTQTTRTGSRSNRPIAGSAPRSATRSWPTASGRCCSERAVYLCPRMCSLLGTSVRICSCRPPRRRRLLASHWYDMEVDERRLERLAWRYDDGPLAFSKPELVELGCFIALTMGQQSWLRLLNIE